MQRSGSHENNTVAATAAFSENVVIPACMLKMPFRNFKVHEERIKFKNCNNTIALNM